MLSLLSLLLLLLLLLVEVLLPVAPPPPRELRLTTPPASRTSHAHGSVALSSSKSKSRSGRIGGPTRCAAAGALTSDFEPEAELGTSGSCDPLAEFVGGVVVMRGVVVLGLGLAWRTEGWMRMRRMAARRVRDFRWAFPPPLLGPLLELLFKALLGRFLLPWEGEWECSCAYERLLWVWYFSVRCRFGRADLASLRFGALGLVGISVPGVVLKIGSTRFCCEDMEGTLAVIVRVHGGDEGVDGVVGVRGWRSMIKGLCVPIRGSLLSRLLVLFECVDGIIGEYSPGPRAPSGTMKRLSKRAKRYAVDTIRSVTKLKL